MKYLKISNKGKMDVRALTLVGASTKRDQHNYIGMFGSGNKYALAYLFRNNYKIRTFTGNKEIDFNTRPVKLKDREFNIIYVNGKESSITTEMGYNWKLWQAIRELYANAVDEGILDFKFVEEINPKYNETHFYIEATEDIKNLMLNIDDYIANNKTVLFENKEGKIYKKHSNKTCIYRKGIKCYETDRPSIFDYDFNEIEVNEDRIVRYNWEVKEKIWKLLSACNDSRIPYEVLNKMNEQNYIENDVNDAVVFIDSKDFSESWKEPLKDKNICPTDLGGYLDEDEKLKTFFVPGRLYNYLSVLTKNKSQPDKFKKAGNNFYQNVEEKPKHKILNDIKNFIYFTQLPIDYEIKVVQFMDENTHGTIDKENQLILLSDSIFEKGTQYILNVIIEEYIHLKTGASDQSRQFQEAVIDEFISYVKKINQTKI